MPKDPIDVYVGQRLRQIRLERELRLETVAKAIGVTYQQVQKYESAANRVSASQLWRLAAFLEADLASLFPSAGYQKADLGSIARLDRLPPSIRSLIGDLAEAIAAAERQASAPCDRPLADPS